MTSASFEKADKENPAVAGPLQTESDIPDMRRPGAIPASIRIVV